MKQGAIQEPYNAEQWNMAAWSVLLTLSVTHAESGTNTMKHPNEWTARDQTFFRCRKVLFNVGTLSMHDGDIRPSGL
jgi:hypothetical protein